jgi:hypothetical protein
MSVDETHRDLHSDAGALTGEHPGRDPNPIVKVEDLAWLEFDKRDLDRAQVFATAFGFVTSYRSRDELHLRGSMPGGPCVIVRRGPRSRFAGMAFKVSHASDLTRLAQASGSRITRLPEVIGGAAVNLQSPDGARVRVVTGVHELPGLRAQSAQVVNVGGQLQRANAAQRPDRAPAGVQRLGHVVLQSTRYREALDWYLHHLGLIVSDFKFYAGQRDRGPTMSFIRCDRGTTPADHHTLALTLGPSDRYVHSAYQVVDFDALAAGGEYLRDHGYRRSWGVGRHIEGSQVFDYWRDPDGFLVEHFTDGDMFDNTLEPGWSAMTASGLAQWGPPATKDFMGLRPGRASLAELGAMLRALHDDTNEFDLTRLQGLMKVATS